MDDHINESTIGKKLGDATRMASVWDQFYGHCSTIINQCPGVRRLSQTDREDCVQEVMMEIVRRFGERHPEDLPNYWTGWVRRVSQNKAADIVRRRSRKPEVLFDDGTGSGVLDAARATAEADSTPGEYVSLVWEALLSLDHAVPVTSYLVFYLRTIEGWSIGEIADLFQITPEQARFRCHRVKKKFGAILKGTDRDAIDADEDRSRAD
jgi:RNA polymerase sigma factor (sigma-70 family)